MNREIKYRQPIRNREGLFKEWFYWGFIDDMWISPAMHLIGVDTRTESQQFTGLTDKNGKEIYEWDIIEVCDWGAQSNGVLSISKIEWDIDEIGWRLTNSYHIQDAYDMRKALSFSSIIGNIYENPELLNP